ncbi:MAG TPA: hypothetical protein DCO77_08080 [Nitrospiraceae bacterium]|nr:hypothetical protein [Nitrospiraceae bacterium]
MSTTVPAGFSFLARAKKTKNIVLFLAKADIFLYTFSDILYVPKTHRGLNKFFQLLSEKQG